MKMKGYEFYFICIFYIIVVVGHLNGMNVASAGQQQVHAISNNGICMLAQRIVQMMLAYCTEKLTNRNRTNFGTSFLQWFF